MSSSARTTSMSTSTTSVPRRLARSPPASGPPTAESGIGDLHEGEVGQHPHRLAGPTCSAPARSRRPGLGVGDGRPSAGSSSVERRRRQPGSPGRRLSARIRIMSGRVRAHHVGARAAARSEASQLLLVDLLGGQAAEQVPVEGPVGGQGHVGHELHPVLGDGPDGRDELERRARVVPHARRPGPRTRRRPPSSGRDRAARRRRGGPRRATTRSRAPRRPATPAPAATMAASCSGVGLGSAWRRSPMTTRRTVEWPTRKPALTARPASRRSRYSANDVQSQAPAALEGARAGCPRPPPSSAGCRRRRRGRAGRWRTRSCRPGPW